MIQYVSKRSKLAAIFLIVGALFYLAPSGLGTQRHREYRVYQQQYYYPHHSQLKGALIGGAGGALVGGLIGHGTGALIGGGAGAGAGYLVQRHRNRQERRYIVRYH
jgi:uncharacterized membrane protein